MNFFTKLFGRNGSLEINEKTAAEPAINIPNNEFKNAFIDENPPINEFEMKKENVLKIFMEQNFYSKGYNDGYDFHSKQSLENGVGTICSEYRHLLDIIIDEKNCEVYELELNKMQIEGMPGNISEQFGLRINAIKESIFKCREEYELSIDIKGNVEFIVNKYSEGFQKGQQQYFNEVFFAKSTGLFN